MIRGRVVVSLVLLGLVGGCAEAKPDDASEGPRADIVTGSSSSSPTQETPLDTQNPGEVQSAWWSWTAGAPSGRNPVEDATGAFCDVDQPSGVWFLAGTFGGSAKRQCAVPQGRAVVAPVVNLYGSKADCAAFMENAFGRLTLDGKQVALKHWSPTPITITGVPNNPVTRVEGSLEAYGCGLWAIVPDMEPGAHEVSIRGSSGDFSVSVDYELTVG